MTRPERSPKAIVSSPLTHPPEREASERLMYRDTTSPFSAFRTKIIKDFSNRRLRSHGQGKLLRQATGALHSICGDQRSRSAGCRRRGQDRYEPTPIRDTQGLPPLDTPQGGGGVLLQLSDSDALHVRQL